MRTVECPQCGTENSEGTYLCKNCGYPLSWAEEAPVEVAADQPDMSVEPGEPEPDHEWAGPTSAETDLEPASSDATAPMPPPAPAPAPPPPEPLTPGINCRVCGTRNPLERTYCMRCGAVLVEAQPAPTPPPRRRIRLPRYAIISAVGAVALIAGLFVVRPWGGSSTTTVAPNDTGAVVTTVDPGGTSATTSPPSTLPPVEVRVDSARVNVTATSTGSPGSTITYDASNMLDGDLETAWNHCNAGSDESLPCFDTGGVGEELTFTFDSPVELARIELFNGYQKVSGDDDRFFQNARIKDLTVRTVNGEFSFALSDEKAPQQLEAEFGTLTTVIIRVVSAYPGSNWQDLGVSEVNFYEWQAQDAGAGFSVASASTVGSGPLHSGCSPGTPNSLPDGLWLGFVDSWTRSSIDFDLVCVEIEGGEPVISNTNSNLRTLSLAASAVGFTGGDYPDNARSVADALDAIHRTPDSGGPPPHLVYVAINGGLVTELAEWDWS